MVAPLAVLGAMGRAALSSVGRVFTRSPVKRTGGRVKPARRGSRSSGPLASRRGSGAPASAPGPSNRMESGRATPLLDKMWIAQVGMDIADKILDKVDGNLPSFTHTISVAVRGGPEADLRRVWYLCCAAAFGRYRNRVLGVQQVHLDATWDITGKACSVTIGYTNAGLLGLVSREVSRGAVFPVDDSPLAFIQRGPDQVTVGGNWPGFMFSTSQQLPGPALVSAGFSLLGGLLAFGTPVQITSLARLYNLLKIQTNVNRVDTTTPTIANTWTVFGSTCNRSPLALQIFGGTGSAGPDVFRELPRVNSIDVVLPWRRVVPGGQSSTISPGSRQNLTGAVPTLPDDGRLITTGEKLDPRVQHPRPQIDGIGRSSTISLVAQALQKPCFLVSAPPCSLFPLGSSGLQAYEAGKGTDELALNDPKIKQLVALNTDKSGGFWRVAAAAVSGVINAIRGVRNRDGYYRPENVDDVRPR